MGMSNEMRAAVDGFVGQLAEILRRESLEQVMRALGSPAPSAERVKNGNGHSNGNGHTRRVTGKAGQKRDPEVLAATVKEVGEYVHAHPGQGVEQIKAALNRTTAELSLPIQKLLSAKVITRKGHKRATKYFPAAAKAKA